MVHNSPGKTQLQGLHDNRRSSTLRLADQQMEMLGHDHVTENYENIAFADLFQNSEKQIASARQNPVTARGDNNCK